MPMESWCPKSKFPKYRQLELFYSSFCPRDSYTVKRTLFLNKIYIRLFPELGAFCTAFFSSMGFILDCIF